MAVAWAGAVAEIINKGGAGTAGARAYELSPSRSQFFLPGSGSYSYS